MHSQLEHVPYHTSASHFFIMRPLNFRVKNLRVRRILFWILIYRTGLVIFLAIKLKRSLIVKFY